MTSRPCGLVGSIATVTLPPDAVWMSLMTSWIVFAPARLTWKLEPLVSVICRSGELPLIRTPAPPLSDESGVVGVSVNPWPSGLRFRPKVRLAVIFGTRLNWPLVRPALARPPWSRLTCSDWASRAEKV